MEYKEKKHYKAIYFDLQIKALKENFSARNPQNAYQRIQYFLQSHKFIHMQYSGYHSAFKTTDLYIFEMIHKMKKDLPWLSRCVGQFEVTDVGKNYDLVQIFAEETRELNEIE
ncbi:hypothetical protein [Anaerostipes sp.]|uniref:hypothetical protein n=1 Tax=Anaerostipes sp. TaxID=1872530 RepID=UPI0025C136F4|nr:hypothetical protein [Anaerostipes sp.]MBS7009144.1 hypothetical protein [Anaerostipes sp.]